MLTDKEIETARTLCEFEQEGPWARQFLSRALDQIDQLRADLAASQREVERLRTDLDAATYSATTIRGSYVDVADALLPNSASAADLIAEARRLRDVERDALPLRGELDRCREIIESLVSVRCDERSDGFITHGVIVADALRYLASIGRVEIVSEQGRRVVARWRDQTSATEDDRPYVCPGCHAVAPERCVPGCIDAEIEAEMSEREYEPTESEDDEP